MKVIFFITGFLVLVSACNRSGGKVTIPDNPFFSEYTTPFGVPPFDKMKVEHYKPAFLKGMEEQKQEIEAILNQRSLPDFENTIVALDRSGGLLRKVSAVFGGLNSANTTEEMQALNKELSPLLSAHRDDIKLNARLFARVKEVYERQKEFDLNKEQAALLKKTYQEFIRGGVNLSPEKQEKLRSLNREIALLQLTFGQNMLKETNAYRLILENQEDLAGLPESLITAAAEVAKSKGMKGKWVFTLHNPSIMPFLQFSECRELREKILKAYLNRGNNGNEADNKEVVKKLVTSRLEKARLMGYDNYAAFVLEDRMAKNETNVYRLLEQIWEPALRKAKEEAVDLQAAMEEEGIQEELKSWDWRYYNEKVMKAKFDIDENQLRPYLQLENVRKGMFYVANQLYGISFTELEDIPKPHEEARAFECKDENGVHLGILYMDYFPRAGKRGGAWCGTYRSQTYKDSVRVAPVVTIVCNFTRPSKDKPALLSPDEASTMFHEFGHALHNLFKNVHYYGISGVPRDFVELPSQLMEHWAFEPEVLGVYATHYQTGELMPKELMEKLQESGKYGQGFATVERIQASMLDMAYHVLKEVPADFDILRFEEKVLKRLGALSQIPPRYRTTYFNHTMGGGYTAGYYSYMWAEVLDADAYQAFVETGNLFDSGLAAKFRQYVLAPGGIEDAMVMYTNFRGTEPGVEALLRNRGLK